MWGGPGYEANDYPPTITGGSTAWAQHAAHHMGHSNSVHLSCDQSDHWTDGIVCVYVKCTEYACFVPFSSVAL